MDREPALRLLQEAGMSGYEAKAYVALLAHSSQMNGYEVAKASGVPRSTVYETLSKLVARGAAFEVKGESGAVSYVALPAEALVGRLRRELSGTIDGLATVLPALARLPETRVVTQLQGGTAVLERAADVVEGAQVSVFVSVWPDAAAALRGPIERAVARGVDVSTLVFGPIEQLAGRMYVHRFSTPEVVLERLGRRVVTVVADHAAVLIAAVDPGDTWGIWSDDPAVALVAAEYVRHDIALQLIAERARDTGLGGFWDTDPELERLRSASRLAAPSRPSGEA
jgi:sugar-specific transcriptional regulator TrmB